MSGVSIRVEGLHKTYEKRDELLPVLVDLNVSIDAGERVAIVGPSGSGKSTLMHMLGLLDRPTSGMVYYDGAPVTGLPDRKTSQLRGRRVGFVFQAHHLLPEHTAMGNVVLPVRLAGGSTSAATQRATALLEAVGLAHRLHHRPGELSGGEQQRVALARALVMGPGLVLADEPTGNLDPKTAAGVFDLMLELNRQLESTMVVVTHSHELAGRFPRRLHLDDGRMVEQ